MLRLSESGRGGSDRSTPLERVSIGGLRPTRGMAEFVAELLAGTPQTPQAFRSGFAGIVRDLGPINRALLTERDRLQSAIDKWHRDRRGRPIDLAAYEAFLRAIGYLLPEPAGVRAETSGVDESKRSPARSSSCRSPTRATR